MAAVRRRLKTRRSVESVPVLRGGKSLGARTALPRTHLLDQGKPAQKHGAFRTSLGADEFRANVRRASIGRAFLLSFSWSLSPSLLQDGTEEESLLTIEIEDGDFAEGDVRASERVDVWLCMRRSKRVGVQPLKRSSAKLGRFFCESDP